MFVNIYDINSMLQIACCFFTNISAWIWARTYNKVAMNKKHYATFQWAGRILLRNGNIQIENTKV